MYGMFNRNVLIALIFTVRYDGNLTFIQGVRRNHFVEYYDYPNTTNDYIENIALSSVALENVELYQ